MKRSVEWAAIALLMAAFILFMSAVFIGIAMVTDVNVAGPCARQVHGDVQEQIRNEAMIQGGLICR